MTSQRDEAARPTAGEGMTDDPIVIERRDEILTGEVPADDGTGYDPAAGDGTGYDRPGYERAGYGRPGSEGPGNEGPGNEGPGNEGPGYEGLGEDSPGEDSLDEDGTASDELVGRHAAPETSGTEPAPLVIPPEGPSPDMGVSPADSPVAAGGPAAVGSAADSPAASGPAAAGAAPWGPASPDPAAPSPAAASSAPAAGVQPGAAGAQDPAIPGPSGAGDRGPPAEAGIPAAALAGQQWPAIQAMFVDDPKGSVQRAAAAADEVARAFVASLQREQAALRATWENETTTEDLRTALQQYRAFCGRLEGLS